MKMILLPSSILVLLYTYPSTSFVSAQSPSSGAYTFPNDVTAFIPSCAQACFSSFVQENFPISVCSSTPSLDCLCSRKSTSGYTIGEGALQCIISEDSVGFCQGTNATTNVIDAAFNMCSGEANAIPNTHATITATLEVQTSAPSIVLVVPTPTSTISPGSANTIASTSSTPSSATTTGSLAGFLTLSVTATPTAVGQAIQPSETTTKLTTPQIVGIAVGSGAVTILVIGGIIFVGCLRRKKILHNDDDSDFGNFEEEHGNSMEGMFAGPMEKKQGGFAPGGARNGIATRVPPPVPPPPPRFADPNMFSRRSVRTEEIGIAISPEMAREIDGEFEGRHPSRLLPEKPALTQWNPTTSQQAALGSRRLYPHLVRAPQVDMSTDERRNSEATQFDVDVTSPVEFSRNPTNLDYGYAYSYEHGGPQIPQNSHQEILPRSWTAPIQWEPRPLDIRKTQSHQSFSQPLKPRSASSSIYTGRGSIAPSDGDDTPKDWQQAKSYLPFNPYEIKRQDSFGSLNPTESTTRVDIRLPELRTVDLSPVAESPTKKSPVGVSPVSYPIIPPRRSDQFVRFEKSTIEPSWRQAELEAAKKRTQKRPRPEDSTTNPMYYYDANSSGDAVRRTDYPALGKSMSPLAERRGKKLGPAFNLDKEHSKKGNWRVVNPESHP